MFSKPKLPHLLISLLLLTLPLERIPSLDIAGATVRLSQLFGLILIGVSLPLLYQRRQELLRLPWVALLLFNLLSFASALTSQHQASSLKTAVFIGFVSLLSIVVALQFKREYIKQYAIFGLIGLIATCTFGIYQFFGDLAGLPTWATGLREAYTKGGIFPFPRIQSTALEPLYFANYLLVPFAVLIISQLFAKASKAWVLIIFTTAIISLSLSRGAQAAAASVAIIALILGATRRRYRQLGIVTGSLLVGVAISLLMVSLGATLYPEFNGKKNTAETSVQDFTKQATNVSQGESAEGRTLTRKIAIQAFREAPVIGIGPGNFGHYANIKEPTKFTSNETIVNNETLEILSEHGLLGLLMLTVFVAALFKRTWVSFRRNHVSRERILIGGLAIGLFAIALQYQLFSTLYITHIWVYIGLLAGLVLPPKQHEAQ